MLRSDYIFDLICRNLSVMCCYTVIPLYRWRRRWGYISFAYFYLALFVCSSYRSLSVLASGSCCSLRAVCCMHTSSSLFFLFLLFFRSFHPTDKVNSLSLKAHVSHMSTGHISAEAIEHVQFESSSICACANSTLDSYYEYSNSKVVMPHQHNNEIQKKIK